MKRKYTFSIVTILVLIIGFALYFFVYVKDKEESINRRAFRILSKLGNNITALRDNRIKYVKNNVKNIGEEEDKEGWNLDTLNKKVGEIQLDGIQNITLVTDKKATAFEYIPYLKSEYDFIDVSDSTKILDTMNMYQYKIDLKDLLEPLLDQSLFGDFMIVNDTSMLYKTISSGFHYYQNDSLLVESIGMEVSSIRELRINGVAYKLFLQPYQFDTQNEWILGGLIRTDKYNTLRLAIPPTIITFLFLAALLTIFSLPFLKLLFMGSSEQLYLSDAMYAGLSIILGTSILIMIALNIHARFVDGKDRDDDLTEFGELIASRFREEVFDAYHQLEAFDEDVMHDCDVTNISGSETARFDGSQIQTDIVAKNYPLFSHIYWIDSKGQQLVKWTTGDQNTPKINVSGRLYFKNANEHKEWQMTNDSTIRFGFESIFSWNSGKALVGLSKKSNSSKASNIAVIAMATAFYSIIDPIVPKDYGFAIIDESANVLFHSDKNKNLQENFLTETEENNALRAAIFAHRKDCFKIKYSGDSHGAYFTPIKDIPLYVVAFKKLNKERSVHAQIMNFTFIMIMIYFASFAFMAFITRLIRKPGSRLKKISYQFGWLMPRNDKHDLYFDTLLMHLCILLLLSLFIIFSSHEVYKILVLITTSIYTFLFTFLRLNNLKPKHILHLKNAIYLVILSFLFIVISAFAIAYGYWMLVIFQLILYWIYRISFSKWINISKWECRKLYVFMLMSWLSITSIFPVLVFYKISYEQEQTLSAKHDQITMAEIISTRKDLIRNKNRNRFFSNQNDSVHSRKDVYKIPFEAIYFNKSAKKNHIRATSDNFYDNIVPDLRARFNDYVIESSDLSYNMATDSSWHWSDTLDNQLGFTYNTHIFDNPLQIKSILPRFSLPFLFILIILIPLIVAFYYILKFSVGRIFFDIKDDRLSIKDERTIFDGRPPDNRILLIGLSEPEQHASIKSIFKTNGITIDLEHIEKPFYFLSKREQIKTNSDAPVVFIHLDSDIDDNNLMQKKLNLIDELSANENTRIVVTTSMELSHYEEVMKSTGKNTAQEITSIVNQMMKVFSSFYQIYCPLQKISESQDIHQKHQKHSLMDHLWQTEFNHGTYLSQIKSKLKEITQSISTKNDNELYDQTIHNIRLLAEPYYTSLWSKCTKKEKYVLYDLADDGLVNPRNTKVITKLLNKGLIIYTDKLRIMNESFRDFVKTGLNPEEAIELELEAKAGGIWNKFRNPILIILVAIVVFLSITQRESISNLVSFAGPIIALIPVLVRAFSALSSAKISTSKSSSQE